MGQPHLRLGGSQVENASAIAGAASPVDGGEDACYRLVSIDAADAPEGCVGEDWFVYRIAQGRNGITGYRCGTHERVSADVQTIVASLNGRRTWTKIKPASDRQRRAVLAARRAAR
jgi:hypothetical protein